MKYRHIINLLWISIPICVIIRAIQLIFTIDSTTGFIKQPYSQISLLITFVVCAAVASIGVMSYAAEDIVCNNAKLHPIVAAACVLTGGMYIYETVSNLSNLGGWHSVALVFLSLLSAITFIAYGLRNIYLYNFPSIMLICPAVYYVIKLIKLFVSTSALAIVTENVFLLFTNSALLWFMFEFASFENHIGDSIKKPNKLFTSGVVSTMLCLVTALPKLILFFSQKTQVSTADVSAAVLMIAQSIFILCYIIGNFCEYNFKRQKDASKHTA